MEVIITFESKTYLLVNCEVVCGRQNGYTGFKKELNPKKLSSKNSSNAGTDDTASNHYILPVTSKPVETEKTLDAQCTLYTRALTRAQSN